jgi:hypothetical protein
MEVEIFLKIFSYIPIGFFDAYRAPSVTGKCSIGKKIRWVGKNKVNGIFREFW